MDSLSPYFNNYLFGPTNPATPKEILSLVMAHVPLRQKPRIGLVNKDWHDVYIDDAFWRNAGAKSYNDFVDRINALPDNLKKLVCNQVYDLPFAEEIQQILLLTFEERETYFSEFLPGFEPGMTDEQLAYLLNDNGVQALMENLITPEQAAGMTANQLWGLLTNSGVQALREDLITAEQAAAMGYQHLHNLLGDSGVQALKEKLITLEQASRMRSYQLARLLCKNGLQALRENRITPEKAAGMADQHLISVIQNNGA